MIEEERYFTIKEAAKLLGVPKKSIKRRIESNLLSVHKRLGKRGFELVIPERELSLEIMSSVPDSPELSLCEFETIMIKRFEAMAAGRDGQVSLTLKLLCEEFAQLRAEINTFNASTGDADSISPKSGRSLAQRERASAFIAVTTSPAGAQIFKIRIKPSATNDRTA